MNQIHELIRGMFKHQPVFKLLVMSGILFILYGLVSTGLKNRGSETEVTETKKLRHTLVIHKVTNVSKDDKLFNRFKYEYHTDAQTIWSSEIYAVGDTLSYTTRKVKRQYFQIEEENIALKAELSQRDKNWKNIQVDIKNILGQYN